MSAATPSSPPEGEIVEHIVLFKVKPSTPASMIADWLASLNSLAVSVPSVLHLVAAPILRTEATFTHLLHARYPDLAGLAGYSIHPEHVAIVQRAAPMCEDIMALDWMTQDPGSVESPVVGPGKAVKITFLKLKEELSEEKGKEAVADVITVMKEKDGIKGLEASTVGESFSPGRAKGFRIGSLAVFAGREEMMQAADYPERLERVVQEVIAVDFVVPEK
ncbi:hypothetical protein MLD38_014741 [Melastoma candidum]|uniref:Uncharacterized protein n=1 Tax=Melastoma candidum TaxID=119954 RepID=A0ACB9RDR5_9MYRT|nr:hypothetical protein MLD38_014741 [Melastoma candidum]